MYIDIAHLIVYSVKIVLYALGNQAMCVTPFIMIFILLQWSGSKLTISLKYDSF